MLIRSSDSGHVKKPGKKYIECSSSPKPRFCDAEASLGTEERWGEPQLKGEPLAPSLISSSDHRCLLIPIHRRVPSINVYATDMPPWLYYVRTSGQIFKRGTYEPRSTQYNTTSCSHRLTQFHDCPVPCCEFGISRCSQSIKTTL